MSSRRSAELTAEQVEDAKEAFAKYDKDGSEAIDSSELQELFKSLGLDIPAYVLRRTLEDFDTVNKDNKLNLEEFMGMYQDFTNKNQEFGKMLKQAVKTNRKIETKGGSSEGITHSIKNEELSSFSDWINNKLSDEEDCQKYLPLTGDDLYKKVDDGILLCKLINTAVPDTVDERAINKTKLTIYTKTENLNLALNSAQAIGCNIVNIGQEDIKNGKEHLILGLLWQVIRIGLVNNINLQHCPGLAKLLEEDEDPSELLKLSPEQILIRWVNYHLGRAEVNRQIRNFSEDIKDSEVYSYLLEQIAPKDKGVSSHIPLAESDLQMRAECMLKEADKIGCRSFVSPADVVKGNTKLNMAFVANLFNNYPALEGGDQVEIENIEETREEKTYRNWMNSLLKNRYIHYLYNDLRDGIVMFHLYDIIKKGTVNWKRVKEQFSKLKEQFEKLENCNYAVELGKEMKFSLVGISGGDLQDGNQTLTLALVWQLMRAYTLSILEKLMGEETGTKMEPIIISWANEKLKTAGKTSTFSSFQDPSLSDSKTILDLIDSMKPGAIKYDHVKSGSSAEEKLSNAKYAVSMARKIGAKVYALPEDITDVKPKMIMTIFACLMIKDKESKQSREES